MKSDVEKGWGVLSKDGEEVEKVIDVDDPRRKLFRLKLEIEQLEVEMAKQAADREESMEDFTAVSNDLRERLDRMGIDDDVRLASLLRGRQDDLSTRISRDMNKFASTEGGAHEMQDGEKGKIVYELYKTDGTTSSKEALLEERLRHLEMAVGWGEEGAPLIDRVEEAMKLAKEVDAKEVDKVAAKAKVIRYVT